MSEQPPIEALKATAHPLRFRILQALRGKERNVGEIEEATGIGQPALSQQLAVLRKADLVETRKEAKLVFYRLNKNALATLSKNFSALAGMAPSTEPSRRPAFAGAANFARLQNGRST